MIALIIAAAWVIGPWIIFPIAIAGGTWYNHRHPRDPIDAISSSISCHPCHGRGVGRCTCTVRCGARHCRGRHSLTTWHEHDMPVLRGDLTSLKGDQ